MASRIPICVRFKLVQMHLQNSDYSHFDFNIESENISGNHRWWLVADFRLSSDKRDEIYFDSFIYS